MAKQHLAYAVDLHTKGLRPTCQHLFVFRRKLLCNPAQPVAKLFRHARHFRAPHGSYYLAITVALYKTNWNFQAQQSRDCFAWHWAGKHIASHHHQLYFGFTDLSDNRFQSRQVRVNVVDSGDMSHKHLITTMPTIHLSPVELRISSPKRKRTAVILISMEEIARDVAVVTMTIANAYLVGNAQSWILVDSGTPGNAEKIKEAADARFGPGAKPRAILLTHGHFDHSGSSGSLAELWGVRVFTHRLEWPYLDGRSAYPPPDPTAPGFFAAMSRFFPARTVNIGSLLEEIGNNLPALGMAEWQVVNTPGHTPGHVCFFRGGDGVLLAGDAVSTMNLDSFMAVLKERKQVCRPPVPATTDWQQARKSVQSLADLRPRVIAAGHGVPMHDAAEELSELAKHFPIPEHGRYVNEPARADETGVTYVPSAPRDRVPKIAVGLAAGIAIASVGAVIAKKRRS
jgi:glyoxylase-like metal-dependent hydrolase (beta-lactamase superfamily II)